MCLKLLEAATVPFSQTVGSVCISKVCCRVRDFDRDFSPTLIAMGLHRIGSQKLQMHYKKSKDPLHDVTCSSIDSSAMWDSPAELL